MRSVFIRCPRCGTVNPTINNFCGNCGVPLVDHATNPAEPASLIEQDSQKLTPDSSALNAIPTRHSNDLPASTTMATANQSSKPAATLLNNDIDDDLVETSIHSSVESHQTSSISGPSFLGLTDNSDSDQTSYLLEDESSGRGGRIVFGLITIAILGAIGWLVWSNVKTGRLGIPFMKTSASQPQLKPATPSPAAATPQPDKASSNSDDKLTTSDSSDDANADDTNKVGTTAVPDRHAETAQPPQPKDTAPDRTEPPDTKSGDEQTATPKTSPKPKPSARAAAEQLPDPHQNKMLLLGEKYLYGQGVARSCQQAMVYLRAAADENNAPAMSHLGALYNTGECVKQDRAQAYSWLRRAHDADPSNEWIERDMNMMWRDMSTQERASIAR